MGASGGEKDATVAPPWRSPRPQQEEHSRADARTAKTQFGIVATTTTETRPNEFWYPLPPQSAYRRPLTTAEGWPLMSRTMTQVSRRYLALVRNVWGGYGPQPHPS